MLCPKCRAACTTEDTFCRHCGAEIHAPSKSLVPIQSHLPTLLQSPQLPRVAAGVGALAIGVGLELLRRNLLLRLTKPAPTSAKLLSTVPSHTIRELFSPDETKSSKLPKGHEIHETVIYMSRVIRRQN